MNKRTATIILKELLDYIPTERKEEYENAIHSILKPQWIDVDESLPCNHKDLVEEDDEYNRITKSVVVITNSDVIDLDYMVETDEGSWVWDYYSNVEGWMPLPQ